MADIERKASSKGDIFVVHSAADASKALIIYKTLQEFGFNSFDHTRESRAFSIGRPVFDNIAYAIKHADIVLILVTKKALSSQWVTLETLVALEKCQIEDVVTVRLVFEGVSEMERMKFKQGTLALIPDIVVDFNKDTWKEGFAKMMEEKLPKQKLLPAGNVAHGLVFNYFIGYLSYVLPVIEKFVKQIEYYTPDKFSAKMFIVIPESCDVTPLDGNYDNFVIEKMEQSLDMDVTHGDKKRKYGLTIYKIKKGTEFYYFCADVPFILATMSKMKKMGFANIDIHHQVNRFSMTLKELVDHRANLECKDTAHIIMFDGQKSSSSPAREIWASLGKEFGNIEDEITSQILTRNGIFYNSDNKYKVTLTYCSTGNDDMNIVDEVIDYLTQQNVSFSNNEVDEEDMESFETKWQIFVLSDISIKDKNMEQKFNEAMSVSIARNQVQVIPIVAKDLSMTDIPHRLRWVTCLRQGDTGYLETMWTTMQEERHVQEFLPAGSLYQGLAYSYLLNYLSLNLVGKTVEERDFKERFRDAAIKYGLSCYILPMVFVIVPESCEFPPPGTQFKNEEHIGPLEPIVMGSRKYFLQLYVITISTPGKWEGKRVCYAREYATPAIALRDMTKLPFAGLSLPEMTKQVEQFATFSNTIMNHEIFNREIGDVRDKCSILYFKDATFGMAGVTMLLEEHIIQCLQQNSFLEPSEDTCL